MRSRKGRSWWTVATVVALAAGVFAAASRAEPLPPIPERPPVGGPNDAAPAGAAPGSREAAGPEDLAAPEEPSHDAEATHDADENGTESPDATLAIPVPPQAPPVLPDDPLRPAAPLAAAAFETVNRHCARCHDARRLEAPLAAAGLADILDLHAIARRPHLVTPGRPESSPLYVAMVSRHMPRDVFQTFADRPEPTADEVLAVRRWIAALDAPDDCVAPKPGRWLPRPLQEDVQRLGPERAKTRRYLSLAHIAGGCASESERNALRGAAHMLLELLSNAREPVRPQDLGAGGTILAFDLADVGWTAETWDWLAARYSAPPPPQVTPTIAAYTGSPQPLLPADWLAAQALDADVYARLVVEPRRLAEFALAGTADATAPIAVENSSVTGGRRALQRLETATGGEIWRAADFARVAAPSNAAPSAAPGETTGDSEGEPGTPDGAAAVSDRLIARLPNGLPAFRMFAPDGRRLDRIPEAVLPDAVKHAAGREASLACLSCHALGPANASAPADATRATIAEAYRAAGLDPQARLEAMVPVLALAGRYLRPLDLSAAAAAMFRARADLADDLAALGEARQPVARRLRHGGLISRQEFDRLARWLSDMPHAAGGTNSAGAGNEAAGSPAAAPAVKDDARDSGGVRDSGDIRDSGDAGPAASRVVPVPDARPEMSLDLSLWLDRPAYTAGDPLTVSAAVTTPCYLTVVSIDAAGEATVLFPNDFEPDNLVVPGRRITVPAAAHGFLLRVEKPGLENIVGICMAGSRKNPPGIHHDFELNRFTLLGKWEAHIARALAADKKERAAVGKPRKKERRRRRTARRIDLPPRDTRLPLPQAWAAVPVPAAPPLGQPPPSPDDLR